MVPPRLNCVRVCAVLCCALLLPGAAHAQGLKFFKNYFETGGHFAAGISLKGLGTGGLATGSITIAADATGANGLPFIDTDGDGLLDPGEEAADILAAFLYWQTVTTTAGNGAAGAKFNTANISAIAKNLNPAGDPPCWSGGGATGGGSGSHQVKTYRADVMPFLPLRNGKRTGMGAHTVVLPDAGSGNQVPATAGATLVFIYRLSGRDLTSTVIYDGGFTLNHTSPVLTLPMLGWYQTSSPAAVASMTQIVGNGQANFTETLTVKDASGTTVSTKVNPFVGPSWDTYNTPIALTPGTTSATVTVERGSSSGSFDCLSWGAIILSTTVEDDDKDGIVDRLETSGSSGQVKDPNTGEFLPDLYAMGARTGVKDFFIEFGMMKSTAGYSNALQTVLANHTHKPDRAALDMVARAFRFAPERINVHFDLGNVYPNPLSKAAWNACPTAAAAQWTTDCAIIPVTDPDTGAVLADGGEFIEELPCAPSSTQSCLFAQYPAPLPCTGPGGGATTCQFGQFPGTVGWKSGFRLYRDEPLNFRKTKQQGIAGGQQVSVDAGPDERACFLAETDVNADGTPKLSTSCKRRFARNRADLFHYVLWAHTLGLPKSDDPSSEKYHQPRNTSGIADYIGADLMITLGLWDFATGTPFMQASTFMHEIGHNLGRRHGGDSSEPNCKPNYQSVMNYLFQVRGLINAAGLAEIGYSKQELNALNETSLSEAAGLTAIGGAAMNYRTRWYTAWNDSFIDQTLSITQVSKRCNGSPVEGELMARVDGQTITGSIDWNANGTTNATIPSQDLNFSGSFSALAKGSNDWTKISLLELGARRNVNGWSAESGYWDTGYWDTGVSDPGYWDTGYWDTGYWDTGYWDTGYWDSGYWDTGIENDSDVPLGELELDTAGAVGNAPGFVTAEVSGRDVLIKWGPPNVGAENVDFYQVYRVEGSAITPTNLAARVPIGGGVIAAPAVSVVDTTTKNNVTYLYLVLAQFVDPDSSGPVPPVRSGIAVTTPVSR